MINQRNTYTGEALNLNLLNGNN